MAILFTQRADLLLHGLSAESSSQFFCQPITRNIICFWLRTDLLPNHFYS